MALLAGKTAVITGGSTGIGFATAKRFVDEGAHVFITGRRQAELEVAVKELGDNATGVQGDVSNAEDLDRLYAGRRRQRPTHRRRLRQCRDPRRRADRRHHRGPAGPSARCRLQGCRVHRAKGATAAERRRLDNPERVDHGLLVPPTASASTAAIKAAIRSFARTWASELRDRKIRVNAVSPGATDTPGIDDPRRPAVPRTDSGRGVRELPEAASSRWGGSESRGEVANAVLFLASDLSSFTTGADIPVDGGINQI